MWFFIFSLIPIFVAPFLYESLEVWGRRSQLVERILFLTIAILVVAHIIPESIYLAGWEAVLLAMVGWFLPSLGESFWHRAAHKIHFVPVFLAIVGLCLHGLIDGVAIALGTLFSGNEFSWQGLRHHLLPIAVILHRFPAAIFLWWLIRPKFGVGTAVFILAGLALMTGLGYWIGLYGVTLFYQEYALGLFQALVGGSLLHVATHRVTHSH